MEPTSPVRALLACDVFAAEIAWMFPDGGPWRSQAFLEMGLHDQPDNLRRIIAEEIEELESDPQVEEIILAYGRCGNGLIGVRAGRCPLLVPQAHDCISILLGGTRAHDAVLRENPGTYFYSPGWIKGKRVPGPDREQWLRDSYSERYGDDPEMIDELVEADNEIFAHHNCAAYVSIFEHDASKTYCENCARHLGWRFRELQGDPSFLREVLTPNRDSDRIVVVPPGHELRADVNGPLFASNPE